MKLVGVTILLIHYEISPITITTLNHNYFESTYGFGLGSLLCLLNMYNNIHIYESGYLMKIYMKHHAI